MAATTCPAIDELRAFSVGDLAGDSFERVAAHVAGCAECEARLGAIDAEAAGDRLVSQLAGLPLAAVTATTDVPRPVLAAARRGVADENGAASDEIAADPGRRFARRLKSGPCRLGRFELLDELGLGSFGYVFRARDTELDRTVAVKIQRAANVAGGDEVDRFLREARSAAQLSHPHIVAVHETGHTDDGVFYLVTEFIAGPTLEQWLTANRPLPRQSALLVAQLADALQYAHERGVIHRDVKPSNVLLRVESQAESGRRKAEGGVQDHSPLTAHDSPPHHSPPHHSPLTTHHSPPATLHPLLTDFGLAKRDTGEAGMTPDGQVMGTPAYMSPEQARGDSHATDARSDIYSLGVILYEMLTGERPFQGNRRMLLLQVLEDQPRPLRQLHDGVPRDLETICLKAMAKSTAERYQTAQELGDDLRRYLDGEPILARPEGYARRLWRWCLRYPLAAGLFFAVVFGSTAAISYLSHLSDEFVQQTALEGARKEAAMLDENWRFYSERVDGLNHKKAKVRFSQHYTKDDGAMPLPATYAIDICERISRANPNMQARIFSRHPWPGRKDGGPRDDFERDAVRWLDANSHRTGQPFQEFYRFTESGGERWLWYARPRLMEKSCLSCHNDPKGNSPKKDWKEGDVGGVIKIGRRLDRGLAASRTGIRGAIVAILGSAAVLLAFAAVIVIRGRGRRKGAPL